MASYRSRHTSSVVDDISNISVIRCLAARDTVLPNHLASDVGRLEGVFLHLSENRMSGFDLGGVLVWFPFGTNGCRQRVACMCCTWGTSSCSVVAVGG